MKRVTGQVGMRPLGDYEFDFMVEDDATDKEIKARIEEELEYYMFYDVEEGYKEVMVPTYVKED